MEGYRQGMTLKQLLEDPNLVNPPSYESKEGKGDGKLQDGSLPNNAQSAMLMPNLWEKTLPFDGNDFTLEFLDLDEFLNENYIQDNDGSAGQQTPQSMSPKLEMPPSPQLSLPSPAGQNPMSLPPTPQRPQGSPVSMEEYNLSQSDLALSTIPGEETFDPRKRAFTDEELRPQPMIKKSKKVFVPEGEKDDKYWMRRQKNNLAAKRSRDARRIKENQIALRAAFLERENDSLKLELKKALKDNKQLTERLAKYEPDAK